MNININKNIEKIYMYEKKVVVCKYKYMYV